ncbi:MAG: nicotinamide mononucleotide transporter [Filimonas sp.]|nr:nicotinamide mononucleotide transporter [Filimonas sp.]
MSVTEIVDKFIYGLQHTTPIEYIAVFAGIGSVFFSRAENILVYPVGIISTIIYIYISFAGKLYAEAGLNIYYTVMSLIGWYMWAMRKKTGEKVIHISVSNKKDWRSSLAFFFGMWVALYFILKKFTDSTVPIADSFASAAAYTGMLLMNKKKIENWLWWIVTNIVSIPLYFIKGYVFTSVQFVILLIMAVSGWIVWNKKMKQQQAVAFVPVKE